RGFSVRYKSYDKKNIDWRLYLVADSTIKNKDHSIESIIQSALKGGITALQLREKTLSTQRFIEHARKIKSIVDNFNSENKKFIPLIINDNVDVALSINADGVHIGQQDQDALSVRRRIGHNKILGLTISKEDHVRHLLDIEPYPKIDYFGTDAVFETPSKSHHKDNVKVTPLGVQGLSDLIVSVKEHYDEKFPVEIPPVVAIGGINQSNAQLVLDGAHAQGIAVISAIMCAQDPELATRELKSVLEKRRARLLPTVERSHESIKNDVCTLFEKIKKNKPLVHHITNYVAMNTTANITLHLGGSPVMSHALEEVEQMVESCDSLLLNPGTLSTNWVRAMVLAGTRANSYNKPVVFDPVGAGATYYRDKVYKTLLRQLDMSVVKGNYSEIARLCGDLTAVTKGVDSVSGGSLDPIEVVRRASLRYNAVVAMSGKIDYVSDGHWCARVLHDSERLGGLTAMGCSVSSLIACFSGVTREDHFAASVGGLAVMGLCAELAEKNPNVAGPASFQVALMDQIANLTSEQLYEGIKIDVQQC
ncbi:thiamine-phosphate diphosphorylase, partial [Acrasis kona]